MSATSRILLLICLIPPLKWHMNEWMCLFFLASDTSHILCSRVCLPVGSLIVSRVAQFVLNLLEKTQMFALEKYAASFCGGWWIKHIFHLKVMFLFCFRHTKAFFACEANKQCASVLLWFSFAFRLQKVSIFQSKTAFLTRSIQPILFLFYF